MLSVARQSFAGAIELLRDVFYESRSTAAQTEGVTEE
jgi:hypothetical protein